MPIYVYECGDCGRAFEELVRSMSSTDPVSCPNCHSKQTKRRQAPFATVGGGSTAAAPS